MSSTTPLNRKQRRKLAKQKSQLAAALAQTTDPWTDSDDYQTGVFSAIGAEEAYMPSSSDTDDESPPNKPTAGPGMPIPTPTAPKLPKTPVYKQEDEGVAVLKPSTTPVVRTADGAKSCCCVQVVSKGCAVRRRNRKDDIS
jgi:hypothetical protein